jgi:hypothetical protein
MATTKGQLNGKTMRWKYPSSKHLVNGRTGDSKKLKTKSNERIHAYKPKLLTTYIVVKRLAVKLDLPY